MPALIIGGLTPLGSGFRRSDEDKPIYSQPLWRTSQHDIKGAPGLPSRTIRMTSHTRVGLSAVRGYYVYIMGSHRGTLYTGVTNDLVRRVHEHRLKMVKGFTSKYNVSKLLYYESTSDVRSAIAREKQIKGWTRIKKVGLIESMNPYWEDLSDTLGFHPSTPDPERSEG